MSSLEEVFTQSDIWAAEGDYGVQWRDGSYWQWIDLCKTKSEANDTFLRMTGSLKDPLRLVRYSRYMANGEVVVLEVLKTKNL